MNNHKESEFQTWVKEGGILRRTLETIRQLDISAPENKLCQQITDSAASFLGFGMAIIWLLDKNKVVFVPQSISGLPVTEEVKNSGLKFPISDIAPFLTSQYHYESSYLIPNRNINWKNIFDKYLNLYIKSKKVKNISTSDTLLTPLFDSSGDLLGLLILAVPDTKTLPNHQLLEAIGIFANSISWVLEVNRYQSRLKEQENRVASFINSISEEVSQTRDFSTLGEVIVQAGSKLLNIEGCSLYLVKGNQIQLTHSTYLSGTSFIARQKQVSSNPGAGLVSWVAATGLPLAFNDNAYKMHPAWDNEVSQIEFLPSKSIKSIMVIPFKDKNEKVIGVISLENKMSLGKYLSFDEDDIERSKILANSLVSALEKIGYSEEITRWEDTGLQDDLHDLINWYNFGVVAWIDNIDYWLNQGDLSKVKESMPQLKKQAYSTIIELKTIHTNLISKALEEDTLDKSLRSMVQSWVMRTTPKYGTPMQFKISCSEGIDLPIPVRNTMVRIASLAVSNVIRHSGIIDDPKIYFKLVVKVVKERISMLIIDNGIGMKDFTAGYGISRMKQLVEQINHRGGINSELKISSKPYKGTRVALTVDISSSH